MLRKLNTKNCTILVILLLTKNIIRRIIETYINIL